MLRGTREFLYFRDFRKAVGRSKRAGFFHVRPVTNRSQRDGVSREEQPLVSEQKKERSNVIAFSGEQPTERSEEG
jgi:hypothetical protein